MVKRILFNLARILFLVILGITFFHNTALAALNCTITPPINTYQASETQISKNPISFTIDTNPSGGFASGDNYDIWFRNGGPARCSPSCGTAVKGVPLTNGTLVVTLTSFNASGVSAGQMPVDVFHAGDTPNIDNEVCTMLLPVAAATSMGDCQPLNFSPSNPKPSDHIMIKPTKIASGQDGTGNGPDDYHHIIVYSGDKDHPYTTFGEDCSGSSDNKKSVVQGKDFLGNGLDLGTFDQNDKGYIVTVNSCQSVPGFGHQFETEQCEQTITVNTKGGGVVTTGDTCNTTSATDTSGGCSTGLTCMGPKNASQLITNGVCMSYKDIASLYNRGLIFSTDSGTLADVCPNHICQTAIGNIGTTPDKFIQAIMAFILSIAGGIAIILIIISGYRLMVSQGNPENIKNAKDQLTAAIIGLLFIIFSLVVLQIIGFNILGLPGFNQ
jgi:hypothetical protein